VLLLIHPSSFLLLHCFYPVYPVHPVNFFPSILTVREVLERRSKYILRKIMMKVNTLRALALLSLLLVVASSAAAQRRRAASAKTAPAAADYFPLRAGDSWTYRHSEGSQFTIKVLKEEKQPDGTLRYIVELHSGGLIHYTYSKPSGWVYLHRTDYTDQEGLKINFQPPKPYLKNPLVAGAKWRWAGKDVSGNESTESSRVIGLEWVEVPAGKFRAMKIISEIASGGGVVTKTFWYAPGVGCVKSWSESGQVKYGYELTEYSFKQTSH
jgi:hypothetical protein